jgi:hypothetical protein
VLGRGEYYVKELKEGTLAYTLRGVIKYLSPRMLSYVGHKGD